MIRPVVTVDDHSTQVLAAMERGQIAGLMGSGRAYQRDMKKALRSGGKGYVFRTTIGNVGKIVDGLRKPWTTGTLWNTVTLGIVERIPGGFAIRVGTNMKIALYWELGHHNIFTKHFERDPKWVPIYRNNAGAYGQAFVRAFTREAQTSGVANAGTVSGVKGA